jgi:hypothetical protein
MYTNNTLQKSKLENILNETTKLNSSKEKKDEFVLDVSFNSFLNYVNKLPLTTIKKYLETTKINETKLSQANHNLQNYLCTIDKELNYLKTEKEIKKQFQKLVITSYIQSELKIESPAFEKLKQKTFTKANDLLQQNSNQIYYNYSIQNDLFNLTYHDVDDVLSNSKIYKSKVNDHIEQETKKKNKEHMLQKVKLASIPTTIFAIEYLFEPMNSLINYLSK